MRGVKPEIKDEEHTVWFPFNLLYRAWITLLLCDFLKAAWSSLWNQQQHRVFALTLFLSGWCLFKAVLAAATIVYGAWIDRGVKTELRDNESQILAACCRTHTCRESDCDMFYPSTVSGGKSIRNWKWSSCWSKLDKSQHHDLFFLLKHLTLTVSINKLTMVKCCSRTL